MKKLTLMALAATMFILLGFSRVGQCQEPRVEITIGTTSVEDWGNDEIAYHTSGCDKVMSLADFREQTAKASGVKNSETETWCCVNYRVFPTGEVHHPMTIPVRVEASTNQVSEDAIALMANVPKPLGKPSLPKSSPSLPPTKGEVKTDDKKTSTTPTLAPKRTAPVDPSRLAAVDSTKPQPSALKGVLDEAKIVQRNNYLESVVVAQAKELATKDQLIKRLKTDNLNFSVSNNTYEIESRKMEAERKEGQFLKELGLEPERLDLNLKQIWIFWQSAELAEAKVATKQAFVRPAKVEDAYTPFIYAGLWLVGILPFIGTIIWLWRKIFAKPVSILPIPVKEDSADIVDVPRRKTSAEQAPLYGFEHT